MALALNLLCTIANMTGPPEGLISGLDLQLWPVYRGSCDYLDPSRDVIFHLYTDKNPDKSQILIPKNDSLLEASNFNFSKPTVVYFHGFLEDKLSDSCEGMRKVYLEKKGYNIIITQANRLLAGPEYIHAAFNTEAIARYGANLIDFLVSKGLHMKDLHVIGFSLGAQVAGIMSQHVKSGKLSRITGIDPAGPLFYLRSKENKLDSSDAEFVDAIHTNAGFAGVFYSVGHIDFWVNNGFYQPGCYTLIQIIKTYGLRLDWILPSICHHKRSFEYYAYSVNNPYALPAKKCRNYISYKLGFCNSAEVAYLGIAANSSQSGDFYLTAGLEGTEIHN